MVEKPPDSPSPNPSPESPSVPSQPEIPLETVMGAVLRAMVVNKGNARPMVPGRRTRDEKTGQTTVFAKIDGQNFAIDEATGNIRLA